MFKILMVSMFGNTRITRLQNDRASSIEASGSSELERVSNRLEKLLA